MSPIGRFHLRPIPIKMRMGTGHMILGVKYLLILIILSFCGRTLAQKQPLSRNDKAAIENAEQIYDEKMTEEAWNEASRQANKIAEIYWDHNQYRNAIKYFEKSLVLNERIGNENGIAMLHSNLGMLSSDVGEYEKAIQYFEKTLAARLAYKDKEGIISALKNLSVAQNNLGMYDQSIEDLEEALRYARELSDLNQIAGCHLYLSETYDKAGDITGTKDNFELYQTFTNMKNDREMQKFLKMEEEQALLKKTAELEARRNEAELNALRSKMREAEDALNEYDQEKLDLLTKLDKSEIAIKYLETEKENERLKSEEALREEKALRNLFLLGAVFLFLLSFFIYRNYRSEKKAKKQLSLKNDQIKEQNDELESLNAIIAKHNKRMQSELNIGRDIQMSMLPIDFPNSDDLAISAALVPAREVGGDLYDVFSIDDEHVMFGVGDVSDKGVPAALVMSMTKTLIKTNANYSSLPGNILTKVNAQFSEENRSSMFISYFLGMVHTKSGKMKYCNAGHNPPLIIKGNKNVTTLTELHGPVLGAMDDYEYSQGEIQLEPGDRLIIYTDGVTEAFNEEKELYSESRLIDIFKTNGHYGTSESIDRILSDLSDFRGGEEQSDDITILSLEKKA